MVSKREENSFQIDDRRRHANRRIIRRLIRGGLIVSHHGVVEGDSIDLVETLEIN
jgi:hypothetical protein